MNYLDNYKFDITCSDNNIIITCQEHLENYICSISLERIKMTEKKFKIFFDNCITNKPNYFVKIKKENNKMYMSLIAQLEGLFELEQDLIFVKAKFVDELVQIKVFYENKIQELKLFYEEKIKEIKVNELDKSKLYELYKEQEKTFIISKIKEYLQFFHSIYLEYCNTIYTKVNEQHYQLSTHNMIYNNSNSKIQLIFNILERYKYNIPITVIKKYFSDIPIITIQKGNVAGTNDIYGSILTPYTEKYLYPFVVYDGDLDLTHYTQNLQTNRHIFDLYYCNFLDEFEYLQYIYKLLSNFYQLYKTQIK